MIFLCKWFSQNENKNTLNIFTGQRQQQKLTLLALNVWAQRWSHSNSTMPHNIALDFIGFDMRLQGKERLSISKTKPYISKMTGKNPTKNTPSAYKWKQPQPEGLLQNRKNETDLRQQQREKKNRTKMAKTPAYLHGTQGSGYTRQRYMGTMVTT